MVGTHPILLKQLKQRILVFDGGMGTELQKRDLLDGGKPPELLNLEVPREIAAIHASYRKAGCHLVTTNTFGGNPFKLAEFGLEDKLKEINSAAVRAARMGGGANTLVAGSVGPLGQLMAPLGPVTWSQAVKAFRQQVEALRGCDLIVLETFTCLHELRAAAFAATQVSDVPVIACAAIESSGTLLTGGDVHSLATALEDLGVFALGLNCGLTPSEMAPFAALLAEATCLPILIQANCGLPDVESSDHEVSPRSFVDDCHAIIRSGVNMIGGCCGSGPAHIHELAMAVSGLKPRHFSLSPSGPLRLGGRGKIAIIDRSEPLTVIGERINPTGRKIFARKLREGDLSSVRKDAFDQAEAGAHILDVNVGTPGVDEVELLPKAVVAATGALLPICIDTTNVEAMERALEVTPGKALLNSASAEPGRLESVMELAHRFGAAVICLPVDDKGVPHKAEDRIKILERIARAASHAKVAKHNLLLDGLVSALGADSTAASETLRTLSLIDSHFGLPSVLGVGNISHGLPQRPLMTSAFLAMTRTMGLSAAIINPLKEDIAAMVGALDGLSGGTEGVKRYSQKFKKKKIKKQVSTPVETPPTDKGAELRLAVIEGLKTQAVELVKELLENDKAPNTILEEYLVPAMGEVGQKFSEREMFLPGLLAAAETMEAASAPLKERLAAQGEEINTSGPLVILATVQGDVHDIGKNIVRLMLQNSGFRVLDLGKDVTASVIVDTACNEKADVIALSALMTTTMVRMEEVAIEVKSRGLSVPLLVGGAVVTAEYADSIGATYCPDAASAPAVLAKLMGNRDG